jgi:hypothetical protein
VASIGRVSCPAAGRAKCQDTSGNDQENPDGEQHTLLPAKLVLGAADPERISQRGDQRGYNADEDGHDSNLPSRHSAGKTISR